MTFELIQSIEKIQRDLNGFESQESSKLEHLKKLLQHFGNNIPDPVKFTQEQRLKLETEMTARGEQRWQSDVKSSGISNHMCRICGYSFGDESANYDNGVMKDLIIDMVEKQKNIHVVICRTGFYMT